MVKRCAGLLIGGVLVACSPSTAHAQPDVKADVAGGYAGLSASAASMPLGWFVSATYNVNDVFGIAGEISGNYRWSSTPGTNVSTSLSEYSFLGGPRLVLAAADKQSAFAHFLIGAAIASATGSGTVGRSAVSTTTSDTAICYSPGLGLDLEIADRTAMRVEINYRLVTANGSVSEFQFFIGVAHRFHR